MDDEERNRIIKIIEDDKTSNDDIFKMLQYLTNHGIDDLAGRCADIWQERLKNAKFIRLVDGRTGDSKVISVPDGKIIEITKGKKRNKKVPERQNPPRKVKRRRVDQLQDDNK